MTQEIFNNPDIGLLFHKLSMEQAQGFASFRATLTDIQIDFGRTNQRLVYVEDAVKELRSADAIIMELARTLTGQNQQNIDTRDALRSLLSKVDRLVDAQTSLDNARTVMIRDLESLKKNVDDLHKTDVQSDEYLTTIKATVTAIGWALGGVSTVALLLAVWFTRVVLDDNKFIAENRHTIERLQRDVRDVKEGQ